MYVNNNILLKISNLLPFPAPVRPDVTGTGTRKPDAGISCRRWPGTLQGTHRGSEGQGKRCRDSLCNAAWQARV
ncbi:unnamed protein product [Staurois parvus]|uniref:Uncharacterized protein n=1 Tax=Staurois parvus TaxID=386267 RepID=A0ABN9E2N9_9NEOB|nr:unnamed protein product [Staurois parvus]